MDSPWRSHGQELLEEKERVEAFDKRQKFKSALKDDRKRHNSSGYQCRNDDTEKHSSSSYQGRGSSHYQDVRDDRREGQRRGGRCKRKA